ncbi:hypothetical protein CPC08DRAFT_770065 [Agrocybe pediades]|nr:hypothetical protein CPC08DRAFT_770065 [Agrocybe pediades]
MSSSDGLPFSLPEQKAMISASLNSTLISQFLFGIYTGSLFAAIYIHRHRNRMAAHSSVIVIGLTTLYGTTMLIIAINWYYTNVVFCKKATTRATIFLGSASSALPLALNIPDTIAQFGGFILADGLLVWRCFYACGGSWRGSILPIALFALEIVLVVVGTTFSCLLSAREDLQTPRMHRIGDRLDGAMYISAALTSLVGTFMIYRQIYANAYNPHGGTPRSVVRKRYGHVVDALVQSSCLYAVVVVFQAVLVFLNTGQAQESLKIIILDNYAAAFTDIITGLAPTLMVARLFLSYQPKSIDLSSVSLPVELHETPIDDEDSPTGDSGRLGAIEQPVQRNIAETIQEIGKSV